MRYCAIPAMCMAILCACGMAATAETGGVTVWEDTFADAGRIAERSNLLITAGGAVELDRMTPDGPQAYGDNPNTVTVIPVVTNGTTYDVAFPQDRGTIELWTRGNFTSQAWKSIVDKWELRPHIFLRTLGGTPNVQLAFQPLEGSYVFSHNLDLSDTEWNFVVIQWDCTAGIGRVYHNTTLLKEKAVTDPQWRPSAQVFRLGAGLAGEIQQVRLLSTVLSREEVLNDYAPLHEAQGELASVPVSPIPGLPFQWHEASWDAVLPAGTACTVRIEHHDGAQWVPVPEADLPGNAAGFAASPVALSGLDTGAYPKLRLTGSMTTQDQAVTAQLEAWRIRWQYDLGPHPRVYLRASDLAALRKKYTDAGAGTLGPGFQKLYDTIEGRKSQDMVYAFLYLMTGEENYATLAIDKALVEVTEVADLHIDGSDHSSKYWYAAITYDWCYDRLTREQKDAFLTQFRRIRNLPQPFTSGGAITGHYPDYWMQRGQLTAAVAIHDEDAGPLQQYGSEYVDRFKPVREFVYPSGTHHQGNSYVKTHQMADSAAALLWRRLGGGDVLPMQHPPHQHIYNLRPDSFMFHAGDSHSTWNGQTRSWARMTGAYYNDPHILYIMDHDYFEGWWNPPFGAVFAMLGRDPAVEPRSFDDLPLTRYFPAPVGPNMTARTGWTLGTDSPDAVVHMRIGNRWFNNHQQYDYGIFQIYYRGILAMTSGGYAGFDADGNPASYGSEHWKHYHRQTISQNGLLIHDPSEQNTLLGSVLANAGGQYCGGGPGDMDSLMQPSNLCAEGLAHAFGPDPAAPDYSYLSGDITKAYVNNKAQRVTRSMVTLNTFDAVYPCAFVVFDRVESTDASFKKTWLLHSIEQPAIDGQTITVTNTGVNPNPNFDGLNYNGKLVAECLLPEKALVTAVGGPGREWWIESTQTNYELDPTQNNPEPGAWRVEVSPPNEALSDRFLHAITVMDATTAEAPAMVRIDAADMVGVRVLDRTVMFGRDETELTSAAFALSHDGTSRILVCDLAPGLWSVKLDGVETARNQLVSSQAKCLYLNETAGAYVLTRTSDSQDPPPEPEPEPVPAAQWTFDEAGGTTAADVTGNGHDAVLEKGADRTAGRTGGAAAFHDKFDRVQVNVPVAVGEAHTVAGWFIAPLTGYTKWLHMACDGDGGVFITATSNELGVKVGGSVGCGFNVSTLEPGWHHVAAVASGTATDFFVDGQYVGTASAKVADTQVVWIGNDKGGNTFSGCLDDVRVYGRALTDAEIAGLVQ